MVRTRHQVSAVCAIKLYMTESMTEGVFSTCKSKQFVFIEQVFLSVDTISGKPVTLADQYIQYYKIDFSEKPKIGPISYPPNVKRETFTYHQDSILFTFYNNTIKTHLRVKRPDKRLNFYEITFQSPNERYSKVFTEMLSVVPDKPEIGLDVLTSTRVKSGLVVFLPNFSGFRK